MISGIAHINVTVPADTLHLATDFYSGTLGLTPRAVPVLQKDTLAWFDIGTSGQQVHVAIGAATDFSAPLSSRHPCFKIQSPEALLELRRRIWEHHQRGGSSAPQQADQPGREASVSWLPSRWCFQSTLPTLLFEAREALRFNAFGVPFGGAPYGTAMARKGGQRLAGEMLNTRAGEAPCWFVVSWKTRANMNLCNIGAKGVEYPQRFFARDFAGNRLEFSL
ncbi:hypothetical protein LTS15_009584 [Exophiala xenobiotica]|nr:hypothetical protein LTS15_009584 [Exophiala xenobiotica]